MTREEWIDSIDDFGKLYDFCIDNGYDDEVCDYIHQDDLSEQIWESIRDYYGSWEDLRYDLNNIDPEYDWYYVNGSLDYDGVDDYDFEAKKRDLLRILNEDGFFEEGGQEEEHAEESNADPSQLNWDWANIQQDEPELETADVSGVSDLSELVICSMEEGCQKIDSDYDWFQYV